MRKHHKKTLWIIEDDTFHVKAQNDQKERGSAEGRAPRDYDAGDSKDSLFVPTGLRGLAGESGGGDKTSGTGEGGVSHGDGDAEVVGGMERMQMTTTKEGALPASTHRVIL